MACDRRTRRQAQVAAWVTDLASPADDVAQAAIQELWNLDEEDGAAAPLLLELLARRDVPPERRVFAVRFIGLIGRGASEVGAGPPPARR